jgi:hypothetical protein
VTGSVFPKGKVQPAKQRGRKKSAGKSRRSDEEGFFVAPPPAEGLADDENARAAVTRWETVNSIGQQSCGERPNRQVLSAGVLHRSRLCLKLGDARESCRSDHFHPRGNQSAGPLQNRAHHHGPQNAEIPIADGRRVINLCANNYLGLADHPALIAAAKEALDIHWFGMASVRFHLRTQDIHKELEAALTKFLGTEDTILYPSCFDANGGLLRHC